MIYKIIHNSKFRIVSNQYLTDCPACKKENHFYMNMKTGLWDCKKCNANGNYYQYLQLLKGISSEDLSDLITLNLDLFKIDFLESDFVSKSKVDYPNSFLKIRKADDYYRYFVKKRKFSYKLIEKYLIFKTSLNERNYKNRIVIPVVNERNKVKGFCARIIYDTKFKRYYNSKGTKFSEILFNYRNIKRNDYDFVIVVEGIFDCLRLNKYAVASFGKKLSDKQISLLQDLNKEIILMFDADAKKELYKYALELVDVFDNVKVYELEHSDPDTYFKFFTEEQKLKTIMKNARLIKNNTLSIKQIERS